MSKIVANAYVKNKHLYVVGVDYNGNRPIPFHVVEKCDAEDGKVDIQNLPESLAPILDKLQVRIMDQVTAQKIQMTAEDLVFATRSGDQNAMSLIVMIGENARKGLERAQYSYEVIEEILKKNPVSSIGSEIADKIDDGKQVKEQLLKEIVQVDNAEHYATIALSLLPYLSVSSAGVLLSFGPNLTDDVIQTISNQIKDEEKTDFEEGVNQWGAMS